jgi:hypothetical protein
MPWPVYSAVTPAGPTIRLQHGTTLQRANAIANNGPDPDFVEPGGNTPAEGFSMAFPHGPYPLGSPAQYAALKARHFPTEGGPAILEVEVPLSIAQKAGNVGGDVRFERGCGLEELLQAWPSLSRTVTLLPQAKP